MGPEVEDIDEESEEEKEYFNYDDMSFKEEPNKGSFKEKPSFREGGGGKVKNKISLQQMDEDNVDAIFGKLEEEGHLKELELIRRTMNIEFDQFVDKKHNLAGKTKRPSPIK